jgi:hypothetical protein
VSKLSKVTGEDGAVGSGVGVGVGEIVAAGVGVGIGVGEAVGAEVGLAVTLFCQVSLFPVFLQTREPEIEFILVHLAPNLAEAPCEMDGMASSRPIATTTEIPLRLMGLLWQKWMQKVKMSGTSFKVWE